MTLYVKMKDNYHSRVSHKYTLATLLTIIFSLGLLVSHAADIDKAKWEGGKALFKSNCSACHNPKADGTGPALEGVTSRWEGGGAYKGKTANEWLHTWIHNWHDAVGGGYPYAVSMAASRPAEMNIFTNLNNDQIDQILLYVENSDKFNVAKGPATTGGGGEQGGNPNEAPSVAMYIFIFFVIVLIAILVAVTRKLDNVLAEKKGQVIETSKVPFYKNAKFIVAACLILFVWLGYETVDAVVHLGRQQGYQPEQPIHFSHKIHAGTYKIDCQYCHQTPYKGKNSNIPSLNTCMNCHKQISSGKTTGTTEIAKIYEHVGWDPTAKAYTKPEKPIEWVRIHNLPDHVYFNHAQHVNAGKVQCQTCHGPIETMDVVYQYAPLSMGWCINCHRNTDVQFNTNKYYSTYKLLHEKMDKGEIDRVTVETIGGTECQRCHY